MNKAAIEKFAIDARNDLIAGVKQRAYQFGIEQGNYGEDAVSAHGHVFSGEEMLQRQQLIQQIQSNGYEKTMEEVAYTWFNRFIALRFMEVNNYLPTHIRVFSDANGAFKPEILQEALRLELDGLDKQKIAEYLEKNQTEDLYRYLLLMQCNALHPLLPVMFDTLKGYMALLLPNNILKSGSVLARLVEDIAEEDFKDAVEIIGWMYQYYNTEPKNKRINARSKYVPDDLPFVTQLFTSDWIVQFIVDNSLGKYWIERNPESSVRNKLKYFIAPKDGNIKYIDEKIDPETLTFFDPCMGSGHILVYAFDILMEIYRESGYADKDAVQSILQKNLFGADIDERAYQLAYFAIMMKARSYDRRILTRGISPEIFYPQKNAKLTLIGSLAVVDELEDKPQKSSQLSLLDLNFNAELANWNFKRLLSQKYTVVCTNPPYLNSSYMPQELKAYVEGNFKNFKADLFSAFMVKCISLCKENGVLGFLTPYVWMFISSYENLRKYVLENTSISSLVQLEYNAFEAACVPVCAFTLVNSEEKNQGEYIKLSDFKGIEVQAPKTLAAIEDTACGYRFSTTQENFSKIPSSPIAYWASDNTINTFLNKKIGEIAKPRQGLATGCNELFVRSWYEVNINKTCFCATDVHNALITNKKWFPYNKGGEFRKWYGNNDFIVNWENDGFSIKNFKNEAGQLRSRPQNTQFYFKACISWSLISSSNIAFRYKPTGHVFDVAGMSCFSDDKLWYLLALCNSKTTLKILDMLAPTINYQAGDIANIPVIIDENFIGDIEAIAEQNISLSKSDWDAFETSWGFIRHPLLNYGVSLASGLGDDYSKAIDLTVEKTDDTFFVLEKGQPRNVSLQSAFELWQKVAEKRFDTLKANEEELNRIFIDIYGLQDELTPEVEDKDVTVRLADKVRDIKSFISYAVGCMFGRYSLDVGGLAYAGGDWDASKYVSFIPDADNIIPICDDDYFEDDITGRFVSFVETVFGENTLDANLQFIADALGGTGLPKDIIRNYFLNGFYADHCKIYQKRPIYWQFESGKKNGFKALMYMHRYQPDLMARMRTDYVHEQQERYDTQLVQIAENIEKTTGAERVKLGKLQKKLQEQKQEIASFEEKVHHLADQHIAIDLDDGVKHNYEFFKTVVTKIK